MNTITAVTPFRGDGFANKTRTWYGRPIPHHVVWVETLNDLLVDEKVVRWINDDGTKHHARMPIPFAESNIEAVIMAMRLSY